MEPQDAISALPTLVLLLRSKFAVAPPSDAWIVPNSAIAIQVWAVCLQLFWLRLSWNIRSMGLSTFALLANLVTVGIHVAHLVDPHSLRLQERLFQLERRRAGFQCSDAAATKCGFFMVTVTREIFHHMVD